MRKKPERAHTALAIWQSALLTQGCKVDSGCGFIPIELHPVGNGIVCTPTASGSLLPFHIPVTLNQPVTITWDDDLSRYIVKTEGERRAA